MFRGRQATAASSAAGSTQTLPAVYTVLKRPGKDLFGIFQAGDGVLRKTAGILSSVVGGRGSVGRWGGEEFLVILPGTGLDNAFLLAEEIRCEVERGDFGITRYVTVSIGVAQAVAGDTPVSLVRRADVGLYRAKAGGRNRAVLGER